MKKLLPAAATALLLAGCAVPVVNTDLPPGWKSTQRYGTGTNVASAIESSAAKYMPGGDDVREMQRDRFGSREAGGPK